MTTMRRFTAIFFLICLTSGEAAASPLRNPAQNPGSPYMRVFGLAEPPYAFLDFCERMPRELIPGRLKMRASQVIRSRWLSWIA